ncbi:MAG: hypothetical protein JSV62_08255 [Promethearchaeota archaeon]|nr:MAG: hypothetical protein JSV62_08255 [Candidatus Lokiarchaeota archaeon]
MSKKIDLKLIEKNILKTAQNGFFEVIIGFVVGGMAFGPIFRESLPSPYRYFLWPAIIVFIVCLAALFVFKYVIQPRMGIVKLGPSLKSIRRKLIIVTSTQFIIQIIFIILLVVGNGPGIHVEGILFILIVGLFIMPLFATIAYLMKYPRSYLIGILIWFAIFLNELFYDLFDYRIRWLLSYGTVGCIIFIIGLAIFIKFLKKYPLSKEEMA